MRLQLQAIAIRPAVANLYDHQSDMGAPSHDGNTRADILMPSAEVDAEGRQALSGDMEQNRGSVS